MYVCTTLQVYSHQKSRMNGSHITNVLAESQPEADSQPPDLADQRYVALPHSHVMFTSSQWARRLSTNKAAIPAFIIKAEMRCRTMAELLVNRLCAMWEQCRSAKVWMPTVIS